MATQRWQTEMATQRWQPRDGNTEMATQRWQNRYGNTWMAKQRWQNRDGKTGKTWPMCPHHPQSPTNQPHHLPQGKAFGRGLGGLTLWWQIPTVANILRPHSSLSETPFLRLHSSLTLGTQVGCGEDFRPPMRFLSMGVEGSTVPTFCARSLGILISKNCLVQAASNSSHLMHKLAVLPLART